MSGLQPADRLTGQIGRSRSPLSRAKHFEDMTRPEGRGSKEATLAQ
jgi:hypothetical protein